MTTNGNGNGQYSETNIIQTTDEDGEIHVFEKISELEVDGQEYALLVYRGQDYEAVATGQVDEEAEEEVVVMRVSDEDGEEVFEAIEDEAEFNKVVAHIQDMEGDDDDDDDVTIDLAELLSTVDMGDDEEPKN